MAREKKIRKNPKSKDVSPPREQNVAKSSITTSATSRKRPPPTSRAELPQKSARTTTTAATPQLTTSQLSSVKKRPPPSVKEDKSPAKLTRTRTTATTLQLPPPPSAKADKSPAQLTTTTTAATIQLPTIPPAITFQPQVEDQVTKSGRKIPNWFPLLSIVDEAHVEGGEELSEPIHEPTNDSTDYLHELVENLKQKEYSVPNATVALLQFIHGCSHRNSSEVQTNPYLPYLVDCGAFFFSPLFLLRHLRPTILFRYLSSRTCIPKGNSPSFPSFSGIPMKTIHQFHVGFVNGAFSKTAPLSDDVKQAKEKHSKRISQFFNNQFIGLNDDEQKSIIEAFEKGNSFVILGSDVKGVTSHIIGCVMFSADPSGIWVNWLAVLGSLYDKVRFGRLAPKIPFRRAGLGFFY
jgi:hypothetical protein